MIDVNFEYDVEELQRQFSNLSREAVRRSIAIGIKRTARETRTEISRIERAGYNIRKGYFNNTYMKYSSATSRNLRSVITMSNQTIPLTEFKDVNQTKRGVTVAIKTNERKLIKGAFLTPYSRDVVHRAYITGRSAYSGNQFQFRHKRLNNSRNDLPIGSIKTVSPFGAFQDDNIQIRVRAYAEVRLFKNIEHTLYAMARGDIRAPSGRRNGGQPIR